MLNDLEIIDAVLQGRRDDFELLVRKYNPLLYQTGRSNGFNHEEAEDVIQETHLAAFLNLKGFRRDSSYKTWLMTIMINQCHRFLRKKKPQAAVESIGENEVPMFQLTHENDTETMLNQREVSQILEQAVTALPLHLREVFVLREVEEFSVKETAGILDISTSNVKVRLSRAKSSIIKWIGQHYHIPSLFEFHLKYCDGLTMRVMEQVRQIDRESTS